MSVQRHHMCTNPSGILLGGRKGDLFRGRSYIQVTLENSYPPGSNPESLQPAPDPKMPASMSHYWSDATHPNQIYFPSYLLLHLSYPLGYTEPIWTHGQGRGLGTLPRSPLALSLSLPHPFCPILYPLLLFLLPAPPASAVPMALMVPPWGTAVPLAHPTTVWRTLPCALWEPALCSQNSTAPGSCLPTSLATGTSLGHCYFWGALRAEKTWPLSCPHS